MDGSGPNASDKPLDIGLAENLQQAQEKLKAGEMLLRQFIENTPAAVAMFDKEMRYIMASRRWLTDYRLGERNIIGRSHYEVFPEAPQRWREVHQRCLAGSVERCEEDRFERQDGTVDWLSWDVRPWYAADGSVGGIIMFTEVITERKRVELALREHEELNRRIIETSPDRITVLDLDGKLILMSPASLKMLEIENLGPLRNTPWINLWPKEEHQQVSEALAQARAGGTGKFQAIGQARSGRRIWWDVIVTAILDAAGKPERLLAISRDITALKQVEVALRQSEQRLSMATQGARVGIWNWDLLQGELTWTVRSCELLGLPLDAEQSYPVFLNSVHPEDRQQVDDSLRQTITENREYNIEYRTVWPDGSIHWLHAIGHTVYDETGRLTGLHGLAMDITERKQVMIERFRLASLVESSQDFIGLAELDGSVFFLNAAGRRLVGLELDVPLPPVIEYLMPEDRPFVLQTVIPTILREGRWVGEFNFRHFVTHEPITVIWDAFRIDDPKTGKPLCMATVTRDITERKRAEAALREIGNFNRAVLNSIPANIAVLDKNGTIIQVNQGWKRFALENAAEDPERAYLGWNYLEVCRRAVASGGPSVAGAQDCLKNLSALIGGSIDQFEMEYPCHSPKNQRWFTLRVAQVLGDERSIVISHFNVTELKRSEILIRELAERLAEADRRKDEFLAMLAHELRNPLAPIRNAVQILRTVGSERPILQHQHEIIDRQIGHMAHLLDDLLDVSRITRGQIELKRRPLILLDVLTQTVETIGSLIEARRHTLHFAPPPPVLRVEGDYDRLVQIVGNLLNNAVKYTDTGGEIWLSAAREGDQAIIRVQDNGIGIAPKLLPRIFELFTQANRSLDRSQGGLGIGLTLVQRLVQLHGGAIEAHSEGLGKGSEFIIRLPALPEVAAEASTSEEPPEPQTELIPRRILVVDDVIDTARSLAELLELWGHQVRVAYDGPSTLTTVRAFHPEVVLLDIGLPGMDGYEVVRLLRAEHGGALKIVALTGYGQDYDRQKARESGFDEHMVKPVDLDALKQILRAGVAQ